MIIKSIPEFGRIFYREMDKKLMSRLEIFDSIFAKNNEGRAIFDWGNREYARAQNYVGVIKVPGLVVEILPKIDIDCEFDSDGLDRNYEKQQTAQQNLLYMLSLAKHIPMEERGLADLELKRMTLMDALLKLFVERLFSELRMGMDHAYSTREENSHFVRGKLLFSEHLRMNLILKNRSFIRHDKFISDTWINRILKATCRRLLPIAVSVATQKRLREALFVFDEVSDIDVMKHHFSNIHMNRCTDRFRILINFCKMVLCGQSPASASGSDQTFSLLFSMDKLFEEFIARFICKYSQDFGIDRACVHPQAAGRREWLLSKLNKSGHEKGVYCLKPDIIIDSNAGQPKVIIDTKWKFLESDEEDSKNGVSQGDIYQMYAYATRYKCRDNVLLFPQVSRVTAKSYVFKDDDQIRQIRVELISLNRNLVKHKAEFKRDLKKIICS
jgi:5-methylcytosine-specific restriction enzyme subunit McrC